MHVSYNYSYHFELHGTLDEKWKRKGSWAPLIWGYRNVIEEILSMLRVQPSQVLSTELPGDCGLQSRSSVSPWDTLGISVTCILWKLILIN